MKFIDLYAGLGGFHLALESLGHECVFASELNKNIRGLYQINFPKTRIEGDIFNVNIKNDIPRHDILCGGFPCQPFSKAGKQLGFLDQDKGHHFFKIIEILKIHKPEYIILENVEAILRHDKGQTINVIKELLTKLRYDFDYKILSPHEFNIPHHRKRIYIVGRLKSKGGLNGFNWPIKKDVSKTTLHSLNFDVNPDDDLRISESYMNVYKIWNKFVKNFPNPKGLPGFPIWSHEFGATYDYEKRTPYSTPVNDLLEMRGSFGRKIIGDDKSIILEKYIPRYSANNERKFPQWKINYIKKNRDFYTEYKKYLDEFKSNLYDLEFSYQKLEWSCKGEKNNLDDKIIQFRQSGLRVSKSNWSPALTTVKTQYIFLPWLKRKMSINEVAQLQSMEKLKFKPSYLNGGLTAFGNAVNVKMVKMIAKNLINGN